MDQQKHLSLRGNEHCNTVVSEYQEESQKNKCFTYQFHI